MTTEFIHPVRVYYEDTDSGGVVYYANYLKFMERARTEWLSSFGIEQDDLQDEQGVVFAVSSVSVDYLKPARFNDRCQVVTKVIKRGRASLVFDQKIIRFDTVKGQREEDWVCKGTIKLVCVKANTMKPCAIPQKINKEVFGDS